MNRKQKLKMVQILFMMVIGAILETVSIGLVVPAIQMIMDPSCVEGDSLLAQIYRWTGFQKPGYFTALILVLIILGFVLKNVFLYFQNVVQLRFVYTNQFETSQRMMINFMKRPYEYYLNADTSVIQRMITSDVNNMYGLILALLQLMSEVIIFVLLAVTLTAMAPQMILTIAALLIVTLLVIKQFLKPIMRQAGIENQDYYSGLYKWIEESVMGIKEIKIANKENYFIDKIRIEEFIKKQFRANIDDDICKKIKDIGETISKWYNYTLLHGGKDKFKEDATALTSCENINVFSSAIATEIHYFKNWSFFLQCNAYRNKITNRYCQTNIHYHF